MSMKYLAAYALANLAKPTPTADDVAAICKAVNIDVEKETLAFFIESIDGRDVATLVAEGMAKRAALCTGASTGAASGSAAMETGGAAPAAANSKEEKEVEEEDDEMGFGLFD
ncbi:unnamed protein product [Phytomonas sp. Hart1]|nr:unnamed protein product [Phytomonas sp. Hart1]|eukprot:CCW67797.1 unnamed protein product [Phytomonas sp. isolate Hart1]